MPSLNKNLIYNFLLSGTQILMPLISIPYLSRILDPEGIGKVSFIDSFTYYFVTIAEFGIVVYGMREIARLREHIQERRKLVAELISLHIVTSLCALILYAVSIFFVWEKVNDIRLLLFSVSFLLVNFFACEWYFLGMEEFKYITLRSLLTRIGGLVSIILLVKNTGDYYIYYAIIALSSIVTTVWNNILLFKQLNIKFKEVNWKQHIKRTRITYLIGLISGITVLLDTVLLRLVSTDGAAGIYSLSIKMVKIPATVLTDTLLVFFPQIVMHIKKGNKHSQQQAMLNNIQLITLIAVPVSISILLLSEPLIAIFLGEGFLKVIPNLRILAVFPFLKAYNLFLSKQVLVSNNREKLYLNSLIISNVIFVLLTLLLSYRYQDTGACYALLASEIIGLSINYYYSKKVEPHLRMFDWGVFLWSFGGAMLFIPIIYITGIFSLSPLLFLTLSIAVCIIVYAFFQTFIVKNELMQRYKLLITDAIRRKSGNRTF